ncbi:MAG: hypothetical protein KGR26_10305, partial [Cyanobacteria bacterium REEB65]|nr:hypothetical protein [Cyanobacteria bacterium REEB65]
IVAAVMQQLAEGKPAAATETAQAKEVGPEVSVAFLMYPDTPVLVLEGHADHVAWASGGLGRGHGNRCAGPGEPATLRLPMSRCF